MTREIVLDTETTGFSHQDGDRIVEIGCVELINHIPTGKTYHTYINPERDMPEGAFRVHGLSEQFLSDKPVFGSIYEEFLHFIQSSTLIIHNAPFDMGFLNAELVKINVSQLKNPVIDTVQMAREKHPGARVGLDALCKHYGIDNSRRTLHGALLDSEILAEVYLELLGGRQRGLNLATATRQKTPDMDATPVQKVGQRPTPLVLDISEQDKQAHEQLLNSLGDEPIWRKYL